MFALKPFAKRNMLPRLRAETPFGWMPEEFSTLFNRFFAGWPVMETEEWPYGWDLTMENLEKEFVVRLELPGFEVPEVKVEVVGDELRIEAEHKELPKKEEKEGEKVEKAYAHVKRVITLPKEIELEKAEALYRNGVLEVHFPRTPEALARKIEIKT
jgi:HSP20 family protein